MRFYSSRLNINYVVIAKEHVQVGTHRRTTKGLSAQFRNHFFDSEVAQKEMRWTDDERKTVEQHLLEHGDMGLHLYLAAERPKEAPIDTEARPLQRCIATVQKEEGDGLCGEPVVQNKDLCEVHQREFEEAMASVSKEEATA